MYEANFKQNKSIKLTCRLPDPKCTVDDPTRHLPTHIRWEGRSFSVPENFGC